MSSNLEAIKKEAIPTNCNSFHCTSCLLKYLSKILEAMKMVLIFNFNLQWISNSQLKRMFLILWLMSFWIWKGSFMEMFCWWVFLKKLTISHMCSFNGSLYAVLGSDLMCVFIMTLSADCLLTSMFSLFWYINLVLEYLCI